MGTAEPQVAVEASQSTDGFQLVIDALKLNGIDTIYALPGIPITDLTRRAQADGMRVLSFRHEQNAGYAARSPDSSRRSRASASTVSAPGFLNGLNALAHATVNCFPMILISGSSEREIVDLQQGDYEEMDQLAIAKPVAKAAYPRAARRGHRRGHGARHPRRGIRPPGRGLSRSARQALRAGNRRRYGEEDPHQGGRPGAEADSRAGGGEARA